MRCYKARRRANPNPGALRCVLAAQAYDRHLNMILGDVEETVTSVEIDDETYEEIIKVRKRASLARSGCVVTLWR
jgi:hypothetical protein